MERETEQFKGKKQGTISQKLKHKKSAISYLEKVVREIVAIIFWLYVLVKLFIFDIDVFWVNKFLPEYAWLLNLKFFILIGLIAIVWLITKNKHILLWLIYIIFYPAIILFWRIPFFIFKQRSWIFAFAFVNALISFFKSIKYNFITSAVFLVSLAVIFGFSNEKLLWLATAMLLIFLLITYVHRFISVFQPSSIFQLYKKVFSGIRKHGASTLGLEEDIKNLPVESLNQKQLEKWTTNLQTAVLFNRLCLFVAKKLKNYQNSRLNVISYVLTILLLIVLTIFSFGAINYGLYKIDSSFFGFTSAPTFFTFFYYSFNNLLFSSIKEVVPIMPISQTVSMIESFFALFLIVIFVSLLLSIKSQKHVEELNKATKEIKEEGNYMESFIRDEYKINSIYDAMAELEKLKASLAKFIYKISENIK